MNCPKCGKNVGGFKFCPYCGADPTTPVQQPDISPVVTQQTAPTVQNNRDEMQEQQQLYLQREQLRLQQEQLNIQMRNDRSKMVCPRCRSNNVSVQAVAEQKKRGCLMSLIWIILAVCTLGAIIWIPLLTRKGSKTRTYAVCQSCGNRWKV